MADIYVRLDYREYKRLEEQLQHYEECETSHTSVEGYYHKALRLDIGGTTWEFQGPLIMQPIREDGDGEVPVPSTR